MSNGRSTTTAEQDEHAASIRSVVQFSERRFDIKTLPNDMQRVYKLLAGKYGEDYALTIIFTIRTAVELHRAWHMTLLTAKILQQLKDKFRLRMSWNLGVFKLNFRVEDGGKELFRKIPYDYDSENQDIYMRIAVALMDGHITIHEALLYQSETKQGEHTAASGLFLRDFPGRIVLYPGVAATCAVIFFNGDWVDFGIAALTGFASGVLDFSLGKLGAGIMTDVLVGTSTGMIGGLFYRYLEEPVCLSSIFLGTLYWFFYGTAFVIGILEIIAGELEVGVTRFIAVSVKTFVLCLGAAFGLLVVGDAKKAWYDSQANCGTIDLDDKWWRIPLYLLCSMFVLGQYRFPVVRYWRALIVMLVGYAVQYEMFKFFASIFDRDNLDTATSNVFGAAASVLSACAVSFLVNKLRYYYDARLLRKDQEDSCAGTVIYHVMAFGVRLGHCIGLGRKSDRLKLDVEKKLNKARGDLKDKSTNEVRGIIALEPAEENLIIETIVGAQDLNIWSILMPALYQLVPGSMIAKLWFNYIFPPRLVRSEVPIDGSGALLDAFSQLLNATTTQMANNNTNNNTQEVDTEQLLSSYMLPANLQVTTYAIDEAANNVFAGLMVISTSLALGLIFGFALVQLINDLLAVVFCGKFDDKLKNEEQRKRAQSRRAGMYSAPKNKDDDPDTVALEFRKAILNGASNEKEADVIFDAVDWDKSDTIDLGELTDYMLNAGLTKAQVQDLYSGMDADSSGEVTRAEFRRAIIEKAKQGKLQPEDSKDVENQAPTAPASTLEGQNGEKKNETEMDVAYT